MPEAAAAFCAAEYPRLVGGLALYVGDVHVAEELAQEALLRACRRWEHVSGLESPGGWTWRVALNLANSTFRRRGAERRAQARGRGPPESELGYDDNWVLDPNELADPIGPGSAVGVIRHHLTESGYVWTGPWDPGRKLEVRVNERLACEFGPLPLPPESAVLRRVSIQPPTDTLESCAKWSRVDLFVNDRGEIEAVTFDIREP